MRDFLWGIVEYGGGALDSNRGRDGGKFPGDEEAGDGGPKSGAGSDGG